jgi:hypothetical protein
MGSGDCAHEGDSGSTTGWHVDGEAVRSTIAPITSSTGSKRERWLGPSILHVIGRESFHPVFLRVEIVLGIGTSDHDRPVGQEDGFAMIHSSDVGSTHHAHSGVKRLGWIVKYSLVVGILS